MHTTAMKMCRPGARERDIAGAIEGIALEMGEGVSFHSIVTQHGETLHNHGHDGILESGRMLLVDAGAENLMNYCSDFTRSYPVNGRFTPMQRDIYEIVLAANAHAFEMAKPGLLYKEVHLACVKVILEGLKSLGLVRGDMDEAVDFANRLAPEHLEVMCAEPMQYLGRLDNAGSVFLGKYAPEPLGDYYAGPNHVLPTSGTARFFSPLSVDSFIKKSSFICYDRAALEAAREDITAIARAEGLEAHARSIDVRFGG